MGEGGVWRGSDICHGCSSNIVKFSSSKEVFTRNKSYYSRWRQKRCNFIRLGGKSVSLVAFSCAFSEIKLLCVNQVLERGPPMYHQVVLGMLCALMRLADFSSPAMRHFQNEALKTIAKYLKVNTTCQRK